MKKRKVYGPPFEGKYPGTTEQYILTRPSTLIFLALLFGWAYCVPGCSRAIDNTVVKETKFDETSKTDTASTSEGGTATEREEGPVTTTTTAGWYEVVGAPGEEATAAPGPVPVVPARAEGPKPVQLAPGVFQVYHPPVTVEVRGPVEEKAQTWEKATVEAKKDDVKKVDTALHTENKSSWGFLNHWYYWVAFTAAIALAGYIFRKSLPILKWIP